jgi:threonine dehydrogenase-like Zn-dependent dehydrogenase
MKASSICGSDIRAIYREHLGTGDEAYRNVIAGHEPCGQVVAVGPGCVEFGVGDRVILYHISGCGVCDDCKAGYMISCHNTQRAAYGWQRDGGHAPYLLAEENTLVHLPDELSYIDGALIACGFGTAWEALTRIRVDGRDRLLVTGLGPVGLAAAMLGRALGAQQVIGVDTSAERRDLARALGLVDAALPSDDQTLTAIGELTGGLGCEASIDCSGAAPARAIALAGTRRWGRCVFVGEGGDVSFAVSPLLIHTQITLYGSWVTSLGHMAELAERLARWNLHPETTVTHRYSLAEAAEAYRVADGGQSGKVVITFDSAH